ncbi:hypothetical protein EC973_007910 [Apophysomyces ossiformis]|uniref:Uncharacterized protein n=1 Tax=Apophysomyces ossiformis TaxID=679940 RepID=A0A8H7BTL5_9FUNG|nr:hypothetical protein EC973_007910 [Apophysomyces ossiformis]
MSSQYSDQVADHTPSVPVSSSPFRRSLNLSHSASSLLGRRFSRSSQNESSISQRRNTTASTTTTSNAMSPSSQDPKPTMHVRIVPNIENPSRSLIFDIVERDLEAHTYIKVGRFTDRSSSPNNMSFKSKVVSRAHCEIWLDSDGKLYLRDTKSSSGTFLNHVRLSPANQESRPTEIRDGDIVQLGVDYQGGQEEIYRSVKMRFELNRNRNRPLSFNMTAFNNLRNLTSLSAEHAIPAAHPTAPVVPTKPHLDSCTTQHLTLKSCDKNEVDECVICLYALAPFQALFVAPCSHTYHYKCIRPLLQSFPGFQCPICRTYSDLEASVAVEVEDLIETQRREETQTTPSASQVIEEVTEEENERIPALDSSSEEQQPPSSLEHSTTPAQPIPVTSASTEGQDPLSRTLVSSPTYYNDQSRSELLESQGRDRRTVIMPSEDTQAVEMAEACPLPSETTTNASQQQQQQQQQSSRRMGGSSLMEKIKMAFFEKRRAIVVPREQGRKRQNRTRPRSYPNVLQRFDFEEDEIQEPVPEVPNIPSSSANAPGTCYRSLSMQSALTTQTLSRQSTTHLAEIEELSEEGACIQRNSLVMI